MTKREILPPEHSLPSYADPTAEGKPRVSREEEAERALKNTLFTPGTRGLLMSVFIATICSVPVIDYVSYIRTPPGESRRMNFASEEALSGWQRVSSALRDFHGLRDLWSLIPQGAEIHGLERGFEEQSITSQWLLPRVQYALTQTFRVGNEQVYMGREGWLFYRQDVDHVIGRPFLDPERWRGRRRADIAANPLPAIMQFRDQLTSRGIRLIIMPVPSKLSIEPRYLSGYIGARLENRSFPAFKAQLEAAHIQLLDITEFLTQLKAASGGGPQYLRADTHWRPETMEAVARLTAQTIGGDSLKSPVTLSVLPQTVSTLGDLARMLRLPETRQSKFREQATLHQITQGNSFWHASSEAEILLLGDSFSNVFSLEALGWGELAGFAEHLSHALGDRPVDCILRNSDGAFATREILSRELSRGRDRLAGKKIVIWEFAARELSFGNWKMLPMTLREKRASPSLALRPNEEAAVSGIVQAISSPPRPHTVPYADHIIALHLVDLVGAGQRQANLQTVVYLWSMREDRWTRAARLRVGDRITVRLRPWRDVESRYDKFNRTELDDPELLLEEPTWGELMP